MTNQEIFDKAVSGIITQGGPSTTSERCEIGGLVECRYRSETGRKCVIGQLIADEFYRKEMEGRNASSSLVIGAITRSIGGVPQLVFMSALQGIHDALTLSTSTDEEFLVSFKEKAYDFAKEWKLSPNVLEMD
jgi:hypothetical protein